MIVVIYCPNRSWFWSSEFDVSVCERCKLFAMISGLAGRLCVCVWHNGQRYLIACLSVGDRFMRRFIDAEWFSKTISNQKLSTWSRLSAHCRMWITAIDIHSPSADRIMVRLEIKRHPTLDGLKFRPLTSDWIELKKSSNRFRSSIPSVVWALRTHTKQSFDHCFDYSNDSNVPNYELWISVCVIHAVYECGAQTANSILRKRCPKNDT